MRTKEVAPHERYLLRLAEAEISDRAKSLRQAH